MRKKTRTKRILSFFLLLALTAAAALFAIGCNDQNSNGNTTTVASTTVASTKAEDGVPNVRGEGETEFSFVAVKKDGTTSSYTVKTDKKTVGEALIDAGLVKGENGQFGLYVTEVDGEYHKYEEDGYYWAFYEDENYALKGVDATEIKSGVVYSLRAAKG